MQNDKFKNELLVELSKILDVQNLNLASVGIDKVLHNYDLIEKTYDLVPYEYASKELETYIVCRKVEGLSMKTLENYHRSLTDFFATVGKRLVDITSNDIRVYLYSYQDKRGISNRSLDQLRSILSAFFNWCTLEGYIAANPCLKIKPIKYTKKEREPLSQYELELLRDACKTNRERAVIEVFYSTGCRVTELENLNITDVNFLTKEVNLFGKGNKYRTSYLNAKAELWLKKYLNDRTDDNPALFIYARKPYDRLRKDGIEKIVRELLGRTNITKKVSPHVFRHTTATTGVANGMPIEEISKLLGHENIATTMIYAKIATDNIKSNHLKCVI